MSASEERSAATGLEPDEHALLEAVVGKRLTGFEQAPNRGHFDSGDWRDDEPLYLTFEDGSRIAVYARGWHDSGGLYVESA